MIIETLLVVGIVAFILQFFDASAGMGYGTLTPILLLMGFAPLEAVSAVIFTSAILSLFTGIMHQSFGNINFFLKENSKIIGSLLLFGIVSIFFGSLVAVNLPEKILTNYIGITIIIIGVLILLHGKFLNNFSWKRLIAFASIASFNKGMTGGGYGPVLAGGQILSGVKTKHAVGITALSEGVISLFGFFSYLFLFGPNHMNWALIIALLAGGLLSTPFAAFFVMKVDSKNLKYLVALTSIVLGIAVISGFA